MVALDVCNGLAGCVLTTPMGTTGADGTRIVLSWREGMESPATADKADDSCCRGAKQ